MAKFLRGISHLNELTNTVSNDYFNSFDHFVFGSVGEWMFRHVLGINPDIEHPGYEHFTIHPRSGGSLTWEKVRTTQYAEKLLHRRKSKMDNLYWM
jgi:hypothetical protein